MAMTVYKALAQHMSKKHLTLSVAESCTGGKIAVEIVRLPNVSGFFLGGIVSYSNAAKTSLLAVPAITIEKHGAVSAQTALKMAKGVRKALRSQWGIAVTGIAGPKGGSKEKPVGLVFYAVVGPKVAVCENQVFKGGRHQIQNQAAQAAVRLLLKTLKH
jgi:PncC family amidohydrolase